MQNAVSVLFVVVLMLLGIEALLHIVEHVRVIRRLEKIYNMSVEPPDSGA